jgi:hypothetical protein
MLRHDGIFTKQARRLRASEENTMNAVVMLAAEAEFAMAAGDGGLDGNAVSGFAMPDPFPHGDDFADWLMAKHLRVSGGHMPDAALKIPVHVRAADADRFHPDEQFTWARFGRVGYEPFFKNAGRY